MRKRLPSIAIYVVLLSVFAVFIRVEEGPVSRLRVVNYGAAVLSGYFLAREVILAIKERWRG